MIQAKVKDDYPIDIVQAHTGREYVKYEWRAVPIGDEAAMIEDVLEYQEVPAMAGTVTETHIAEPASRKSSRVTK